MLLKRIHLMGFKSFADRTEMDIVPGVTAVVGPNGCGKSNISDAIRWVLGEQSAKSLRGGRMEDVIFAGTELRKAVNFCEVELVLDNAHGALPIDFLEVSVMRRVFRTGDSEYLLNGQLCRLRDIAELFMDTGVGKEAYSIIGQGRIEEILSSKSEDRRGIFEEAAGIVKFKSRRRDAERKLNDAEQNLLRVRDILAELENQLIPLSEQAAVAKQHLLIQNDMKALQVSVLVAEMDQLLERRREQSDGMGLVRASLEQEEQVEQEAIAQLNHVRAQVMVLDESLTLHSNQMIAATTQVEQCEADRRVAFERQENALATIEELHQIGARLQTDLDAVEVQSADLTIKQITLAERVAVLRADLTARTDGQGSVERLSQLKIQVADARVQLIEAMRTQAASRNEASKFENAMGMGERRLERIREDLGQIQQELAELADAGATAATRQQSLRDEKANRIREADELSAALAVSQKDLAQQIEQSHTSERLRLELQSKLVALQSMQQELDGYSSGPKSVLQGAQQGKLRGIHGSVASLISVAAEFELAIETALGAGLQQLVVDSEDHARQAIEFLKKRQLGRATFLPLSNIKGRRIPPHDLQMIKSATGFVGLGADLVVVDKAYIAIIDSLLGQVVIAQSLPEANTIARVLQHRIRLVTLGGDVVHPGGSMSGGSVSKRGTSILGRNREIEDLLKNKDRLDMACSAAQIAIARSEESVHEWSNNLQMVRDEIRSLEDQMRAIDMELVSKKQQMQRLDERASTLIHEQQELVSENAVYESDLCSLQQKLLAEGQEVSSLEVKIQMLEQNIEMLEEDLSGHRDALTELRVELAEAEEALRGCEEAVFQLRERISKLEQDAIGNQADEEQTRTKLVELRHKLLAHEQEGRAAQGVRDALQLELEVLRIRRSELNAVADQSERACAALGISKRGIEERIHLAELAANRIEMELEAKSRQLSEEFELGLDLARERYPLTESLAVARPRVMALKHELEAHGSVNLGSIEEYERVSERAIFLRAQEEDLGHAQGQLQSLIIQIDDEMASRFKETFAAVRNAFQEVFTSLFGGGHADIHLEDEAQALSTGIAIEAAPAGKKMQTLSLLSGGERALTALALLFAILKVKPVPFCILDEVEAALDEANVTRFAEYLRAFSIHTQFIVITHRRGTMESADVLYGVTMQESGVSKLVSVRILDEEQVIA